MVIQQSNTKTIKLVMASSSFSFSSAQRNKIGIILWKNIDVDRKTIELNGKTSKTIDKALGQVYNKSGDILDMDTITYGGFHF